MSGRFLDGDWFPAPVPRNVSVGPRSYLYSSYAFLHCSSEHPDAVRIGADTGVYEGTVFELGPHGTVHVGDLCALVGPVLATDGHIEIGDGAFISYGVVLADVQVATPPTDRPADHATSTITLGEDVWIGTMASVLGPVTLGDGAIVGAGCVITEDVAPYTIVAGDPARPVGTAEPGCGGSRGIS